MASVCSSIVSTVRAPTGVRSSRFAGARVAARPAAPVAQKVSRGVVAQAHKAAAHPHRVALPIPTSNVGITKETTVDKCVNAIRFLAIDAVEKAKSGHPGLPMGCAPMGYILYTEAMTHNPKHPQWFNRDRFVLSAGHGCMLQYALLHLTGYDSVKLEDLKQFRQLNSKTPGHPENFVTNGIEVTTGPLGAGIANAVGLALAEKHLAARFNKPGMDIVDHYTYVIMGDGCNMEGLSGEAASLAGHWGLSKLIVLYDDNGISIDGHTDISFTEDVSKRFESYGWHTQHVKDGNVDYQSIRDAIAAAKKVTDKPSFIKVTTLIGYGSPNKADTHDVHGAALGAAEVEATRKNLGWKHAPFEIPEEVTKQMGGVVAKGAAAEAAWNKKFADYAAKYPKEAADFKQLTSRELPAGWESAIPKYEVGKGDDASRNHSQANLNALAKVLPGLIGGSADLAPSNMTLMKMFGDFQKDSPAERNVRFGVREHAMGCIANGIGLHNSGLIPYCATFFIFTDYMRAAMRLAALSETGTIFVMTHDSIGVGEDGPTHQPIEHLASFRAMPNIIMFRPADGNETAGAYKVAIASRKRPSILALSRQKLRNMAGSSIEGVAKGGYIIHETSKGAKPDCILIATGSEVNMAEDAALVLEKEGKKVRVVSMPAVELFEEQSAAYKESVLPAAVTARVSVEAATTFGWDRYVGPKGKCLGINSFGASGPAPAVYKHFGLTTEAVVAAAKSVM